MRIRAGILTLSDRSARGEYEDLSGAAIVDIMEGGSNLDIQWEYREILPDDEPLLANTLQRLSDDLKLDLILTTGGTGPAPRDRTPEATRAVIDREIPGIPEAMRAAVRDRVPTAVLSRGVTGIRGETLIVNLPGSPKAVRENMEVLLAVLEHLLMKIKGDPSECGSG